MTDGSLSTAKIRRAGVFIAVSKDSSERAESAFTPRSRDYGVTSDKGMRAPARELGNDRVSKRNLKARGSVLSGRDGTGIVGS